VPEISFGQMKAIVRRGRGSWPSAMSADSARRISSWIIGPPMLSLAPRFT